ncbi:DUF7260 family protein [Halorubrum vacuolatum]|uniref:DUF7260 domain-containing protein n=1 Tax=Halorubrum vacuolatum TaxID=63740 RepID=A0A238UPN4_HALVU|nr:hypothetical protein [Halorubrum vacuolatum]SNR23239.1 hypothetical protein SAMN06264855_10184 [Halorubrum vacuolatum]
MSIQPGGDATFRVPREGPTAEECTTLSCELSGVVTDPGFLTLIVVVGLLAFVAFAYLKDAAECCREERRRVVDERDAFEEFSERVESLDPVPANTTFASDGPVVGVHSGTGFHTPNDEHRRGVFDSYESTVMALPHYQQEYDETVTESLAAELGVDMVTGLSDGGTFSPALQSAIVTRSRHAAASRAELADAIDVELEELSDTEAELARIDRTRRRLHEHLEGIPERSRTDALIDVYERFEGLESECNDLAKARQRSLRDPPMTVDFGGEDAPTFYRYLYGPLERTSHPVLSELTALADRLQRDRDRIVKRIADAR